jgi:hypothetical protein
VVEVLFGVEVVRFGVGFGFGGFVGDEGVDFVQSEELVIFDVF